MITTNNVIHLTKCAHCGRLSHQAKRVEEKELCSSCFETFLENVPPIEYYLYLERKQNEHDEGKF